ncbi:hypothetical protein DN402_16050 [Streptomyces sp. SW4]|nr:hypothetical protein DN402_16050 [Streptomyces sp. SW4]
MRVQLRGGKPRHSSSLTLGLSSRCGRIVGNRNLIKTVRDKWNWPVNQEKVMPWKHSPRRVP